jgi:hypothetical protein
MTSVVVRQVGPDARVIDLQIDSVGMRAVAVLTYREAEELGLRLLEEVGL